MTKFQKGHSPWNKGRTLFPLSKEHRERIGRSLKGKPKSAEHRGKIGSALRNKAKSSEHRSKLSQVSKTLWENPEYREKQHQAHLGLRGYWKGKKLSLDHCEKLRDSHLGKKSSPLQKKRISEALFSYYSSGRSLQTRLKISQAGKGRPGAFKGKHLSEAHRNKIGDSLRGAKSHLWRGGISFEPYSPEFNDALKCLIRKRDSGLCQLCKKPGRVVHHINYAKTENQPLNLITLCKSCHARVNSNRDFWSWYLGALQLFDYERIPGVF